MKPQNKGCTTCRYWSDQIFEPKGRKMKALCLNPESIWFDCMASDRTSCSEWKEDTHGAIDEPGIDPTVYADE